MQKHDKITNNDLQVIIHTDTCTPTATFQTIRHLPFFLHHFSWTAAASWETVKKFISYLTPSTMYSQTLPLSNLLPLLIANHWPS